MTKNNSRSRRDERRAAAEKRQAEWDALSTEAKMEKVRSRVGTAKALASNEARKLVDFTGFDS